MRNTNAWEKANAEDAVWAEQFTKWYEGHYK
jgi:hypothetical protein